MRKFMMFPGVGEKTAIRFIMFLIQSPQSFVEALAKDIIDDICRICSDETRDKTKICVVESIEDVISVERAGIWDGLYHVLWGVLSAQEGADVSQLKIKELISRITTENIKEVLLFTDTTVEGEATAMYIKKLLSNFDVKITRPAYGIPMGMEVEYLDPATLKRAIHAREEIK
jgi:recombination protein RecR